MGFGPPFVAPEIKLLQNHLSLFERVKKENQQLNDIINKEPQYKTEKEFIQSRENEKRLFFAYEQLQNELQDTKLNLDSSIQDQSTLVQTFDKLVKENNTLRSNLIQTTTMKSQNVC